MIEVIILARQPFWVKITVLAATSSCIPCEMIKLPEGHRTIRFTREIERNTEIGSKSDFGRCISSMDDMPC